MKVRDSIYMRGSESERDMAFSAKDGVSVFGLQRGGSSLQDNKNIGLIVSSLSFSVHRS